MSDRYGVTMRHMVNHNNDAFLNVVHFVVEVDEQSTIRLTHDVDDDMMESLNGGVFLAPPELKEYFPPEEGIRYVVFDAATRTFLPMTEDQYAITEV